MYIWYIIISIIYLYIYIYTYSIYNNFQITRNHQICTKRICRSLSSGPWESRVRPLRVLLSTLRLLSLWSEQNLRHHFSWKSIVKSWYLQIQVNESALWTHVCPAIDWTKSALVESNPCHGHMGKRSNVVSLLNTVDIAKASAGKFGVNKMTQFVLYIGANQFPKRGMSFCFTWHRVLELSIWRFCVFFSWSCGTWLHALKISQKISKAVYKPNY